jgi:hypothetical protein
MTDVRPHIAAASDQLNADDLLGGPITVQIIRVQVAEKKVAKGEQPVSLGLSGGHMAFRPCKTMLRVLVAAWGPDASVWQGRWLRLYRDPSIRFGGDQVGGVRISAMSDIPEPMTLALTSTRGKKAQHRVDVLRAPQQEGAPTANLDALLEEHGLTREHVNAWLSAAGKPTLDEAPEKVPGLAAWLAADLSRLTQIRSTAEE